MTKNKILISIGILLVVSLVIILNTKKIMKTYQYPEKMPTDFNFIAKIIDNEYSINTYNNTFSKTINFGKDTIISFKISNNEKKRIYNLIKEYNIIKYPNYFTPPTHIIKSNSFDYYFKCTFDSINVEINWEFNTESEEKDATNLMNFLIQIFDNILEDKRIKDLPESERSFM